MKTNNYFQTRVGICSEYFCRSKICNKDFRTEVLRGVQKQSCIHDSFNMLSEPVNTSIQTDDQTGCCFQSSLYCNANG